MLFEDESFPIVYAELSKVAVVLTLVPDPFRAAFPVAMEEAPLPFLLE